MFGFAKKIGMTRVFVDGAATPVTALQLGDNVFVQQKTDKVDGYVATQVAAFPSNKPAIKSRAGHITKHAETSESKRYRVTGEFKMTPDAGKTSITIEDIASGKYVDVTAITKGRGFAGVVKRHGFAGLPASRGHDHVRSPGSTGSRWPQRVMPGKKMSGHMGAVNVTVKSLKIVGVDIENKLFFVAGSVPGANTGIVRFAPAKNKTEKKI